MWRTYSRGCAFGFHSSLGDYQQHWIAIHGSIVCDRRIIFSKAHTPTEQKEFRITNMQNIWVKPEGQGWDDHIVEDLRISFD